MMKKKQKGFTLVELLVVIAIIIMLAAMSMPAMSDFMKQRRLRGAARLIQMSVMETRARAIAQREDQHLAFFVTSDTYTLKKSDGSNVGAKNGVVGSLYSFDANNNNTDTADDYMQVGQGERLPQFIEYHSIGDTTPANFQYDFYSDGTIKIPNDQDNTTTSTWDIVFRQKGISLQCGVDVVANTGGVITKIEEIPSS